MKSSAEILGSDATRRCRPTELLSRSRAIEPPSWGALTGALAPMLGVVAMVV
jgi:hypothetical protein